ncbi:MAG: PaaI family thioesterase [Deltaproteobacteria bacterium]|nr:MAG: PaaI family thioesterase [Deltaproteobacteria bacterium]TMB27680.1 MAG: PaaI family thioesterase [Deltaproteobacteria bacterium]TMB34491.1 MAG: PaaI family thioesterase [Deltaproteobacteria bacterium]
MEEAGSVPEGFTRIERGGHFLASLGPLYAKKVEHGLVVAMRIEEKHLNTRGIAHGGMLVTLADSALGIAVANHGRERALSEGAPEAPPRSFVTVNLSVDFIASAHEGDFVEAHVGIEKVGARLAFATCFLHVGKRRVLRASGVFATVTPAKPKERFEG